MEGKRGGGANPRKKGNEKDIDTRNEKVMKVFLK